MTTGFPAPRDDDSEDIVWGLTTGAALWKHGAHDDALVWLQRAIDAATDGGAHRRAEELKDAATLLSRAATTPLPLSTPITPTPRASPQPPLRAAPPASSDALRQARAHPAKPPPPPVRAVEPLRLPEPHAPVAREDTSPVMTSAPPLATLTQHRADATQVRGSPPPPTIVPDLPLATIPPLSALPSTSAAKNEERTQSPEVPSAASPLAALLDGIAGLTAEQRAGLSASAAMAHLGPEEEVRVSGLVLLVEGEASVGAAITDIGAKRLSVGEPVLARGSIADALALRLVAETDAVVATWDQAAISQSLGERSELLQEWQRASDRVQAIAGSTIGPIGDRLDAALQSILFKRLEVKAFQPGATIASAGQPVPGMVIVGVGSIELERDGSAYEKLGPGDFLFATEILGQAPAPASARAGAKGVVVLLGPRATTYDVLMSCPPLLEIFSGG